MEVAGFVFGIIGTIDVCIRAGRALYSRFKDFKHADSEVNDLVLLTQALWSKIERQLLVLRRTASRLADNYQDLQNQMLERLQAKLDELMSKVDRFQTISSFQRRVKYAVYLKSSLQRSVTDLETWHRGWDPSWLLIARLALPDIDAEIRQQRLNQDSSKLQPLKTMGNLRDAHRDNADTTCRPFGFLSETLTFYLGRQVKFSTATVSARSDSHALVILDNIEYRSETNEADISNDVQSLARVLSKLDPVTCNLLKCEGVKRNVDGTGNLKSFSLVFQMPPTATGLPSNFSPSQTKILSLRNSLLNQISTVSLSYRLAIAKSLARAVIFVHSASFVHKNIRPETVLTTESGDSFLIGFQRFRAAASHTYMFGDNVWHENLYRHPTRQGLAPEEMYTMQHDVYSLGVCLLEIGLWTSFVHYVLSPDGEDLVLPGSLEIAAVPKLRDERKRAFELKRVLTELAKEKLPSQMGDRYTSLVVSCLTCLDKDGGFVDKDIVLDEDEGLAVGAEYIRKILNEMETISF